MATRSASRRATPTPSRAQCGGVGGQGMVPRRRAVATVGGAAVRAAARVSKAALTVDPVEAKKGGCGKTIDGRLKRWLDSRTAGVAGQVAEIAEGPPTRRRRKGPKEEKAVTPATLLATAPRAAEVEAEVEESKLPFQHLQAIVINLDRRPDRMEGCTMRLKAHCPWLQPTRFSATDGRQTVIPATEVVSSWHTGRNCIYQRLRSVRKGWDDLDSYRGRELELSPGERGCASSHIRAWQYCLERCGSTERPILVLEDDAAPSADFTAILSRALANLPQDAHVLYLGYSQAAEWRREISQELVESEYVWTTVGYILWPAGARLLLSQLPVSGPVDNWMAGLCADGQLKAYCTRPKIVYQADVWNVNSDVAHSDEQYWGPDTDIQHSDELYWGLADKARAESCLGGH
mmetsp:Transcript_55757/g.122439  ORF Transcript_55757/g.122439 Transcript_55757/m.122439 type:complete len:405 (-) Transcript_55757:134-1348(-)